MGMATTAPTAPSAWQFRCDRRPVGLDRTDGCLDCGLVNPPVRVETRDSLGQPVTVLGRTCPPDDALKKIGVLAAQTGSSLRAERSSQDRLILDHDLRRRGGRPAGGTRRLRLTRCRSPLFLVPASAQRRITLQSAPVEIEIGVRVLERFHHLGLERASADMHVRGRAKQVQHSAALRTGRRPVRVHDEGRLVATLVASYSNERQSGYLW